MEFLILVGLISFIGLVLFVSSAMHNRRMLKILKQIHKVHVP